eukprot:TRINITY_DN10521_c0_g1_i5.p2 TRINITY_DN10521_c0_g1~~TRINITY_DN10521_c0_g1_i5.p2  ORF type:complete len:147 (+),score=19.55 TRINITY_DN10521_c0_g1_i5:95-535(+)
MADNKSEKGPDGDIEVVPNIPNMKLADMAFSYQFANDTEKANIQTEMMASIKEDNMLPFYEDCCATLGWSKDDALVATMAKNNEEKMKQLDETLKDAEENLGEVEIRGAYTAKAVHYCTIGDKVYATAVQQRANQDSAEYSKPERS